MYLVGGGKGVPDVFVGGGGVEAGGLLGGLRLVVVKNSVIFVSARGIALGCCEKFCDFCLMGFDR